MNNYEGDRLITNGLSSLFMGGIAEGISAEFASEVPLRCFPTICRS